MDNSSPEPPQSSPDTSISRKHRSGPTREDLSFYPSTGDDVRKILEKGLANHRITPEESELIDEFLLEEGARRSWSLSRKIKLASTLVTAREWFPPYHETILSDIYRGFDRLKDAKSQKQRRYKQNSIRDFYIAIKQFFTWLIEHKIVVTVQCCQ